MFKRFVMPTLLACFTFFFSCSSGETKTESEVNPTEKTDSAEVVETPEAPEAPAAREIVEYKGKFKIPYLFWETWYATPYPDEDEIAKDDDAVSRLAVFSFSPARRSYAYYDGCNIGGATFTIIAADSLAFEIGAMTQKNCGCETGVGIPEFAKFTPRIVKEDTMLYVSAYGKNQQIWRRPGKWMFAGKWEVNSIGGNELTSHDITIDFDTKRRSATVACGEASFSSAFTVKPVSLVKFTASGIKAADNETAQTLRRLADALKSVESFEFSYSDCSVKIQMFTDEMALAVEIERSLANR